MKKILSTLCMAALVLGLTVAAVACSDNSENGTEGGGTQHTHTYGDWTQETAPTLFEDGSEYRVCTASDCPDADKGRDTRTISADGKTTAVYDYFTFTADKCTQGESGIILNENADTTDGVNTKDTGAATYFSKDETVKNYEWDGEETTISFDLDLSALTNEGDYTMFVLAFNQADGQSFKHVDEIRIGIAKTATGFNFNEMVGAFDTEELNLAAINATGAKAFTEDEVTVSFTFAYDADTNELSYTLGVDTQEIENTKTMPADVVGLRSLWNARLNKDGVELSNLVKA